MTSDNSELAVKFLALIEQGRPESPTLVQSETDSNWESTAREIIDIIQETRPDLWNGDCLKSGQYPSHSEADFALVGRIVREALRLGVSTNFLLSFTKHVFRQSALFRPEKWQTVITQTIPKIIRSELENNPQSSEKSHTDGKPNRSASKDFFDDLVLSESHVAGMHDAKFIVPNLIVQSHLVAIAAPANSGKTALLIHFSAEIAQAGYKLYYVNCDASPSDLKRHFAHAKQNKYQLIAPDAIQGKSPNDVILKFRDYQQGLDDLSNIVIILDTLKKFVDVIEKRAARELYSLLRALTVRGCTVVLLGHTNKHPGRDGQLIFEGTGDLRNDVDELFYLDAEKDESKSLLRLTTRPDKVRADIKPRSFVIHLPDRTVEELDKPLRILRGPEAEILDLATEGIWQGNTSQKDLVAYILDRAVSGVGQKKIKSTLSWHAHERNRITVRKAGRAKDLVYGLTEDESAQKAAQDEAAKKSPF